MKSDEATFAVAALMFARITKLVSVQILHLTTAILQMYRGQIPPPPKKVFSFVCRKSAKQNKVETLPAGNFPPLHRTTWESFTLPHGTCKFPTNPQTREINDGGLRVTALAQDVVMNHCVSYSVWNKNTRETSSTSSQCSIQMCLTRLAWF